MAGPVTPVPPRGRLRLSPFPPPEHCDGWPGRVPRPPGEVFMATDIRLKEGLPEITEALVATYTECLRINHLGHKPLPSREAIVEVVADLLDILYPGYVRRQNLHMGNV